MEYLKLSEIAYLLNGYAFKSAKYVKKGIRIIRIANVQDGCIVDEKPCYYPFDTDEDIKKFLLEENDLLVSLTGNVGRVGMITKDLLPAALNQRVCCIRIKDRNTVNKKYLFLFFRRKKYVQECIEASKGVAQLNLSTKWLENYLIPIPPLSVQERIVARIEELFSQLDAGVETLKKTKAQLAVYRQAVLKDAFGKILEYVPLSSISESRLGKMLNKEKNVGKPRRYLRNINVRWFGFDLSDLLEMRIEDTEMEKYSIHKGDLVVCEGGEPGRCAVWENDEIIFYQKALHRVRFKDGSNPRFHMYFLWYAAQTGQLKRYFTGTGIKHLTGQSLVKIPVPTAKIEIQNEILFEIESRLSVCDSIEKTVGTALQQAEVMRQSILKQAFEGGL